MLNPINPRLPTKVGRFDANLGFRREVRGAKEAVDGYFKANVPMRKAQLAGLLEEVEVFWR
jgi:hypothetical protein